jgi:YbbR domain-containing protein
MKEKLDLQKGKALLARALEKWPVKVLSIVAAIILFVFHRMGSLQERFFSAPLQLEISGNLVPSNSYPHNIRVTLRGDANSIYPVSENDIEVYLDLTRLKEPGSMKAPVQVRKKGTALETENIEIGVDPMEVNIELDTKISKYVPVTPKLAGTLENGFELVSYTLEPNQVQIDGPLNLITTIAELATEQIDLTDRNADFIIHMRLASPSPLLSIRGDGLTEFRGVVRESIMIRSFDAVPITITNLREGLRAQVEPATGSLRLEGPQREMEEYQMRESLLSVDCSALTPGTHIVPVKVTAGQGFSVSRRDPLEAVVTVAEIEGYEEGQAE